jgi:hypothetical protein
VPYLDPTTLRKLSSYPKTRDGREVPNTISGSVYDYACWNWALSGATLTDGSRTSNSSIINNTLTFNINPVLLPTAVRPDAGQLYLGTDDYLDAMTGSLQAALQGGAIFSENNAAQRTFLTNLASMMMYVNGLTPIAYSDNNTYNLVIRTSNWWNTDHWALRLNPGSQNAVQFIQTVPETPLMFSCSSVWDEGLGAIGIGVDGLHQNQVDQLSTVGWCPCRMWNQEANGPGDYRCRAVLAAGSGQCSRCGFVTCANHLGSYELNRFVFGRRDTNQFICPACRGVMGLLT